MDANGFGVKNQEGERILELCQTKELRVINKILKTDREKLGGGNNTFKIC